MKTKISIKFSLFSIILAILLSFSLLIVENLSTFFCYPNSIVNASKNLDKVNNVSFENGYLSFDHVDDATSYKIYVNDVFLLETEENVVDLSNSLLSGSFKIVIYATCGNLISDARLFNIDYTPFLSAPLNLNINQDSLLSWSKVKNASSYSIIISLNGSTTPFSTLNNFLYINQDYDFISVKGVALGYNGACATIEK